MQRHHPHTKRIVNMNSKILNFKPSHTDVANTTTTVAATTVATSPVTTNTSTFSIKHWPAQERPRERLISLGAAQLTDAELLAIFLRSGTQQYSAVELARRLIQQFGSLSALLDAPQSALMQCHGLGPSKYSQLMAVKELGKRYLAVQLQQPAPLDHSQAVQQYLRYELADETQEVFAVLCLDAELRKIAFKKLFYGAQQYCSVSINQILRYVIAQGACSVVVAHNHPQADVKPSTADIALTQQLAQALKLVEVELIDHIIIAKMGHFSFAEQHLLKVVKSSGGCY